ncbi:unnamed protein product, partial [Adineta steineri]
NNHLIPYCRRPDDDDDDDDDDEKLEEISKVSYNNIAQKITFKELSKQGITSEQLISWSAPIDVAERYEINNDSSELFYNCSSSWFGSKCQYRSIYDLSSPFDEIVEAIITERLDIPLNLSTNTCYRFLTNCDRGPWTICLDWREICDGKVDCISGEDESWCKTLDMNTCADDEYRCHYGGQCIPLQFVRDSKLHADCLDGSDAIQENIWYFPLRETPCSNNFEFQCQDYTYRYPLSFPCGNGENVENTILPFTGFRCSNQRDKKATLAMLTSFDHISGSDCQEAFRCSLLSNRAYGTTNFGVIPLFPEYFEGNWDKDCELLANYCSDEWLVIPAQPVMFGYLQYIYLTNRSINEFKTNVAPDFVCFNARKCPSLLSKIVPINIIDGLTCCHISDLTKVNVTEHFDQINNALSYIYHQCSTTGTEEFCTSSSYFHCNQSLKCIPYHRVGDGFKDCFYNEDELFPSCQLNDSNRIRCMSDSSKCLVSVVIGNGNSDCPMKEDEQVMDRFDFNKQMSFSDICNGGEHFMYSVVVRNETDETNCEWWPCNHPYVRCNGIWDCLNGIDEVNCQSNPCSFNEFPCENDELNSVYCLPISNMYHKQIDSCTVPHIIEEIYFSNEINKNNENYYSFNKSKCIRKDNICRNHSKAVTNGQQEVCALGDKFDLEISVLTKFFELNEDKTYLCTAVADLYGRFDKEYFLTASGLGNFPTTTYTAPPVDVERLLNKQQTENRFPSIDVTLAWYCHQGVLILFGINQTKVCLCPPNYFGSQCQWQNQRVSLTLQFKMQSIAISTVVFELIIMLIDEKGIIAPNHEQITYIPARDCDRKHNIYLLYPHRPKRSASNYSIRIDLFDKITLKYWSSWYVPIPFQFLPVNRISTQLNIIEEREHEPCPLMCGKYGRCMQYINTKSLFFCQCDQGYSGSFCNITHQCQCSNGSLCLGSSICVCPLHRLGTRCYLKRSICQSKTNPCQHNGLCLPIDDRIDLDSFFCICEAGYTGERCQHKSNLINIDIDNTIPIINSFLYIHYITAFETSKSHPRTTILKKIAFDQNSVTIHIPQEFNILFVQIPNGDYYLTILREKYIPTEDIHAQVSPKQRCPFVHDLLNDTFLHYEYMRRVKYYPLLCQQYSQLMCFYDEYYMCICDSDRFSNCFTFNFTIKHDCSGQDICNNNGQCFQNREVCPTTFLCMCEECYYGDRCQFTTKGYIFSLDPILGYHIKPNININRQPLIIKLSISIITLVLIFGLINGSLSLATFHLKKPREVGCGYYLFASSIISISMIIILTIKVSYLVISQILPITNRSSLFASCISIDVILKILLASSEWLNACVGIERTYSIIKGVKFDKNKSKIIAKRTIIAMISLTTLSYLHDPIHRQLAYDLDGDQTRIWCFSNYSSALTKYNSFITLFHFLFPFSINVTSALLLIIIAARLRVKVDKNQTFKQHFLLQLQQHKHILIAPSLLVLLSLPRLIISFTSRCMRSARQPWLHLIVVVYTWSFAAATPSFRCKLHENDNIYSMNTSNNFQWSQPDEVYCKTNMKISVKECQRCYIKTKLDTKIKPCENFIFDQIYYDYTLVEEWSMVCDRTVFRSAVQNVFFLGYMIGSVFFGIIADRYGRRPIISACLLLTACSGFICAFFPQKTIFGFWPSYLGYTLGRFILACATRGLGIAGFVLGTELVGPKNKFLAGIILHYCFPLGQLVLSLFAYYIREWRRLTLALSLFTIPFIFLHFVIPESARWMISKGQYEEAEKELRKIAKTNNKPFNEEAFQRMIADQEKSRTTTTQHIGILSLFQSKIMFIITMNLFFQWFVQNLSYYGVSQSTGSWGFDPYLSFTISACVEILAYVGIHLTLNRIGRKIPYFTAVFCFFIIAIFTILVQSFQNPRILTFILNILSKFFVSASYGTIYIYANELFPTRVRSTGMGMCSMAARVGAIVATTSNDMLTRLWINLPTVLFGGLSLLAALVILILPETLNKTLPQTIEDTEQMGLVCIRVRDVRHNRKTERQTDITNDHYSTEDNLLSEQLKSIDEHQI